MVGEVAEMGAAIMRIVIEHHYYQHPSNEVRAWEAEVLHRLDLILNNQETIMIDTTRILAAVAKERTENASLRALVDAQTKIMTDTAAALKAAMDAGNDPAAIAKVQADLDQAATDLETDNDATDAAVKANTPAAGT